MKRELIVVGGFIVFLALALLWVPKELRFVTAFTATMLGAMWVITFWPYFVEWKKAKKKKEEL